MQKKRLLNMKKQFVTRDYNFSDAELYTLCMERLQFARRDQAAFTAYAYPPEKLDTFAERCARFAEQASDDELVGEQMLYTQKKNEAAEKLKSAVRSVMLRVAQFYDMKSGRYRKFGTGKINDMSDPQLLLCGRRVARVAEQQLAFLHETGLRQTHLDEVRRAASDFENAIHIQQDKIADRDIGVERRTEIGNELYRELVTLCNIGKDIWVETNRAKYEAYILYESNNEQKKARKAKLKAAPEPSAPHTEAPLAP